MRSFKPVWLMIQVNIHEAKTKLSKLLVLVAPSQCEGIPLMTADRVLQAHELEILPA